ncbi:MAG: hypothetical protein ACRDRX_21565 [Pseudonocardiaceae bacterium]
MYIVDTDDDVDEQIAALPAKALSSFAELMTLLELSPWAGASYDREQPSANMRTHPFGPAGAGFIIYLILEQERRVSLLRVVWLD